jgi:hypothetical protein
MDGPASAGKLTFISQTGTVSATADGNTVTDTLPQFQSSNVSATAGTPQTDTDYAMATVQSSVSTNEIHLVLTSDVFAWGNEGAAEARIEVTFSVNKNTDFVIELETAEATGSGWLGDCAFITLSNDDGIIFRRNVGGGYDSCNNNHPDADMACKNRILRPGTYSFEMIAKSYAPATCGTCKGYAVASATELRVTLP